MAVTARQFVDWLRGQLGEPYRWGAAGDDEWDCSQLPMRATQALGVDPPLPDGSWIQARWCKEHDLLIPVQQGIDTEAALLLRFNGDPFTGPRPTHSHVAVSLGNGATIEARPPKVAVYSALNRGWTHAGLIYGITYPQQEETMAVEDLTQPGEVFHNSWEWAKSLGVMSTASLPTDGVEKQELAVHLHRFARVILAEIEKVRQLAASSHDGVPAEWDARIDDLEAFADKIRAL